jgi:hypothetical protein
MQLKPTSSSIQPRDLAIACATQCQVQQAGLFNGTNLSNNGSKADLEGKVTHDNNKENGTTHLRLVKQNGHARDYPFSSTYSLIVFLIRNFLK